MRISWNRFSSIFFLVLVLVVLSGFYSLIFRSQDEMSEAELRTLQKIPSFSIKSFYEGQFQKEMDSAISDQFLFSAEIKQMVKDFENGLTDRTGKFFMGRIKKDTASETRSADNAAVPESSADGPVTTEELDSMRNMTADIGYLPKNEVNYSAEVEQGKLMELSAGVDMAENLDGHGIPETSGGIDGFEEPAAETITHVVVEEPVYPEKYDYIYMEVVHNKVYKLDDSGYVIQKPSSPDNYEFDIYPEEMLSKVTYPKYVYFIESSMSFDFREPGKYNAFETIKKKIPADGYDMLSFRNFEEYKNLFYQTDHHWNYKGSYQGYVQCMRLLEGDGVILREPVDEHTYDTLYNGSLARDNAIKLSKEKFTVYLFDIPDYRTFVNDKEAYYGYRYLYESDEDFPHNTFSNHYGMYYGDDHAKVVYKFDNPEAESILILATSFSNAINELIASHYKETHVLDYRHYRKQYGEDIDAEKYMRENNLSKLLIIGDISSLGRKVR